MRWLTRFIPPRTTILCLVLLAVTGCSSQIAYRFADTYIAWKIRDYVDLTSTQREQVDVAVNDFLQWHAETEMPRYLLLLDDLDNDVASADFSASRIEYYQQAIAERWAAIRLQATEPALALLPDLNDDQVAELIASIADNIQQRADEFASKSSDERRKESIESVADLVERFMGSVNEEQRHAIRDWSQAMPDMTDEWIEYRVTWAEEFRNALLTRHEDTEFEAALMPLFEKPRALRSEDARRKSDQAKEATQSMVLSVLKSSDAQQREHMRGEFADLADDLRGMMRTRDIEPAS